MREETTSGTPKEHSEGVLGRSSRELARERGG